MMPLLQYSCLIIYQDHIHLSKRCWLFLSCNGKPLIYSNNVIGASCLLLSCSCVMIFFKCSFGCCVSAKSGQSFDYGI